MGAPVSSAKSADQPAAETLLTAFKTINAAERRKHASVLNYWLSIRGDKEFPPLHDLDPLELSDAGPNSILLELISGGHDAEVRHLGEGLVGEERVVRTGRFTGEGTAGGVGEDVRLPDRRAERQAVEARRGLLGTRLVQLALHGLDGGVFVDLGEPLLIVRQPIAARTRSIARRARS
jgi:hypothetical protein